MNQTEKKISFFKCNSPTLNFQIHVLSNTSNINVGARGAHGAFTTLSLSCQCFAQAAEEDSERMFTELIDSMKRRCSEVKTLIRAQEKTELSRAEELRQRLDGELTELRARNAEMQQLLSTDDHIDFIKVTYRTVRLNKQTLIQFLLILLIPSFLFLCFL